MTNFTISTAIFALIAGLVPAFVWLWFWLKEDKAKPEPKILIARTFLFGALAVIPAFVGQKLILTWLTNLTWLASPFIVLQIESNQFFFSTVLFLVLLALIEEVTKFFAAYFGGFINRNYDEPIDAMIYIITAAIGFAAVENTLFLIDLMSGEQTTTLAFLLTSNLRFLGATVAHITSSAILGGLVALTFYANRLTKFIATISGLILATLLHAIFNLLIINSIGFDIIYIFAFLWLVAILIIYIFERIKAIKKPIINSF